MRPAALTTTTPDTRSFPGRSSSDGAPPDGGFDAALAQLAPDGAPVKANANATAGSPVPAPVTPETAQGIAALLAKLASAATSASGFGEAATAGKADTSLGGTPSGATTAKSDAASNDTTAPAVADPLLSIAAILPGVVAAPVTATAAKAAEALSNPAQLSSALGVAVTAKTIGVANGQPATKGSAGATAASADLGVGFVTLAPGAPAAQGAAKTVDVAKGQPAVADLGVGLTLVASATHLAPVAPAAMRATPHDATATDAWKSGTAVATGDASATHDPSSPDAAPAASVGAHAEAAAGISDGTIQAIAGAVTSLAADAAPARSAAAQSAPAAAADPAPASAAPARSLTLQLNPEHLGSVTVQLHLTAGGLDVHLAVDDRKTLASISQARDELAQAIGDNGYRVESLVIRGSDASSTSTAGSNDSARSQSEAGAGQGFSGGGSGGSGGDAPSSRQRGPQASAGPRDPARDRGNDGVFV